MIEENAIIQGRYHVTSKIGQGGMGAIYEAVDRRFRNRVAIKETLFSTPDLLGAFEREARLLRGLKHKALPGVIDYFQEGGSWCLVMDFVPGEDLSSRLKRRRQPFRVAEVVGWGLQIVDILEYLHAHEPPIIHRDIKPHNIKLTPSGDIILLDFGLSKGSADGMSRTPASRSLAGFTPSYAPLEQVLNTGTDARSDLYSLAATLYYLLTLSLPPDARTRATAGLQGHADPLRPACELNPSIPEGLAAALSSCLAQDPAERPQTAGVLRTWLREYAAYDVTVPLPTKDPDFDPAPTERGAPAARSGVKVVGRAQALGDLRERLQRAASGERQIVFVTGEPGIGKTALVDAIVAESAGYVSLRVARGQCVEGYGGKEAFYPVLEALNHLFRNPDGERIVEAVATHAPTWLVQFPSRIKPEHRAVLQCEILGATRERMLREICEALETITRERTLLLVVEDLQWVDPSTVDLLSALARRTAAAKLMVVATYRPVEVALSEHPVKAVKQELRAHGLCHEIALDPLGEAAVASFLATAASGDLVPDGFAELVHRHSGGNPLFMIEALDHMRRRGLLARERGWQLLVPIDQIDLEVPDGLRHLIEEQIERLGAQEQRVLEVASVSGVAFSPSASAAGAKLDPDEFEDVCERLVRLHQIVRPAGAQHFPDGSVSQRFEFVHALYREVLYRRQSAGRRAGRHRSIGERLEELYAARTGEAAGELAYHFEEAADWTRAVKHLRVLSDTAGRRFAPREAASILEHALELVARLPETERAVTETEILERLATIYSSSHDLRGFEAACERLIDRAAHYGLVDAEARALQSMAMMMSRVSFGRFGELRERSRQLTERQKDPGARALSRAAGFVHRIEAGEVRREDFEAFGDLVAEVREAGDRHTLARVLLDYSLVQSTFSYYRDAYDSAVESLTTLLEGREENPYLSYAFQRYLTIVIKSSRLLGDWGAALREIDAGVAAAKKNGDALGAKIVSLFRAHVFLLAMDYERARSICESVSQVQELMATPTVRRYCRTLAGIAEVGLGNLSRADEHFTAVVSDRERQPVPADRNQTIILGCGLTELWLARGDLERARREADRFLDASRAAQERTSWALAWDAKARIALAEGDTDGAEACVAAALETMQGYEVPVAAWRVHATAAKLNALKGDADSAAEFASLSRATIDTIASSIPDGEPLRSTFLAAPPVAQIVALA